MNEILKFAGDHVFLAWCALWLVWGVFWMVVAAIVQSSHLINRVFRSINVLFRGWPPEHLDADGDWKTAA